MSGGSPALDPSPPGQPWSLSLPTWVPASLDVEMTTSMLIRSEEFNLSLN